MQSVGPSQQDQIGVALHVVLLSPSSFVYTIGNLPLTCVSQHPYLGVTFDSNNILCASLLT